MGLKSGISQCGDSAFAQYKDVAIGEWKGPVELTMTGRGYACVITDTGTRWAPSRWVRLGKEINFVILSLVMVLTVTNAHPAKVVFPRPNIWVTIAKETGQESTRIHWVCVRR